MLIFKFELCEVSLPGIVLMNVDERNRMGPDQTQNDTSILDTPLPGWIMILILLYAAGVMAVLIFPLAGNWRWLEGWIFTTTFAITTAIGVAIVNKKNPRVIRNRMKVKKTGLTTATRRAAGSDWWLMPVMTVGFFGALMLPALGHRFGWTTIPFPLEMVGVALVNTGVTIMNVAMLQNSYASKLLDINEDQILVDTGLYSQVRHPLYSGISLMILAVPIALGSLIAIIPALIAVLTLVVRIRYEEEMLEKGMDGYVDYQTRVRYKLIRGLY
jgi:protein-S-isoprenylcysteine O-methyltransferase Ste14